MIPKDAASLAGQLKSLRAQLSRERSENRRRNDLFDKAIRRNDLREVGVSGPPS